MASNVFANAASQLVADMRALISMRGDFGMVSISMGSTTTANVRRLFRCLKVIAKDAKHHSTALPSERAGDPRVP